jgi:hypothetical protein
VESFREFFGLILMFQIDEQKELVDACKFLAKSIERDSGTLVALFLIVL